MKIPRPVVITGPTATGKSALGVQLAKRIDGEIISADSMQIYKYMDIGTAKPTMEERLGVAHHLIDFVQPGNDYSVARYVKDASVVIDDICSRGKQPVIVGGTGLYIDSLLAGRSFCVRGDENLRRMLSDEYDTIGGEAMLAKLYKVDRDSAEILHSNDKKRIVRALETFETTGKPISRHNAESKAAPPRYDAIKVALSFLSRTELYARINARVDDMLASGLISEVNALLEMGVPRSCTAMQAIGYKEISDAITTGSDINAAVEMVKIESRRYAKRQLTWLRRDNDLTWLVWDDAPDMDRGIKRLMELLV